MAVLSAEDVEMLKTELQRADLRVYTVVVMAERDLDTGNVDGALARLRVDADKLRCYDTPINRLLASR